MSLVVLEAYSKGYPSITNRIRAAVYRQTDPQAFIAQIIDSTPGHPQRYYTFPGLPVDNYGFTLDVIDNAGVVTQNLAQFDVVPGQRFGLLTRKDEQIKSGATNGFTPGLNFFVFDGTEDTPGNALTKKPDYIGWDIVPSELNGRGILVEGVDYSWDPVLARFDLLIPGDIFPPDQYYNIHFDPGASTTGNPVATTNDVAAIFIDSDTVLNPNDFGKRLIIEPASDSINITLPPLVNIVEGRQLFVDIYGVSTRTVNFIASGSDVIRFLRGKLIACTNESFVLYKSINPNTTQEFRVSNAEGNFKSVGNLFSSLLDQISGFNCLYLDGTAVSKTKYKRLYEEFVLNLNGSYLSNFDNHFTGNNKYRFSLADSLNPNNSDLFYLPDFTGLHEISSSNVLLPSDFVSQSVQDHDHDLWIDATAAQGGVPFSLARTDGISIAGAKRTGAYSKINGNSIKLVKNAGGGKTLPNSYIINKYILV